MRINITIMIFLFAFGSIFAQKQLSIYFPDSANEKEITLSYQIKGIFYMDETQKTNENILAFEVPDSIAYFNIKTDNYQWLTATLLFMLPNEKLEIILDPVLPPQFRGKYADFHKYLYTLCYDIGVNRIKRTFTDYMNSSEKSFFSYIQNQIDENTGILNAFLADKYINESQYQFAKNEIIADFLFRASSIPRIEEQYLSKMDSISFFNDLNNLLLLYEEKIPAEIALPYGKAYFREIGVIPFEKVDLGLSAIYINSAYHNKKEQEVLCAKEIVMRVSWGMLDSAMLVNQRSLYQSVFPNSIYNPILNKLKPPMEKDYVLGNYSLENGLQEYGIFKTNNLSQITGMLIGPKPVFIDFWATWCPPCIKEFSYMNELDVFLKENNIGLMFVSLDYAGAYDKWKKAIEKYHLEGLHYLGTPDFVSKLSYFQTSNTIPRYVLIDANGQTLIERCEFPSSSKLINQIKTVLDIK